MRYRLKLLADLDCQPAACCRVKFAAQLPGQFFDPFIMVVAGIIGRTVQYMGRKIILRVACRRSHKSLGINIPIPAFQEIVIIICRVDFGPDTDLLRKAWAASASKGSSCREV